MKQLIFGHVHFDRMSIPDDLRDLALWPAVDESALQETQLESYRCRRDAIIMFVRESHLPMLEIERQTGLQRREIYRIFSRCIAEHPDGRIYGFRGALPYVRINGYRRTAPIQNGAAGQGIGATGAFMRLLENYPDLQKFLSTVGKRRRQAAKGMHEVRQPIRRIHKEFLQKCRDQGIGPTEYPFNQDLLALRSLATHLRKLREASFASAAGDAGAEQLGREWPSSLDDVRAPITRAYETAEFDGHKIDLRLTIKVKDPYGLETVIELHRIWILVIIDIATRAVLGYSLALGREYTKDDIADAIQSALLPHVKRKLTIAGLAYRASGGFPSEIFPEAQYACWDAFRFDNARSHLSDATLKRLTEIVGCWPDAGPIREPNERPFIERFFDLIARHFAHRITGTTGSSSGDIVKKLGDPKGDINLLMRLDELEELVDVILSDYNGESHGGIGGRTPLEAMQQFINKKSGFVRQLALERRNKLCLLQDERVTTIRGSAERSVRPHINFEGARYSSGLLSASPSLIGKKIRFYFHIKDLRYVQAFYEDGTELGILTASRPWCFTPHSLRLRQEILRLKRLRKLEYSETDDPVQVYIKHKRLEAMRDKRAANDLAKANAILEAVELNPPRPSASDHSVSEPVVQGQEGDMAPESTNSTNKSDVSVGACVVPLRIKRTITF